MRRRDVIAGLLIATAIGRARAQQTGKVYRIAVVHPSRPVALLSATGAPPWQAFFKELDRLGYREGKTLAVERYSGEARTERYAELVPEVVSSKPDAIFVVSVRVLKLFKAATATIPIVGFTTDPVIYGIVSSLAHPGGNITGVVADVGLDVWDKQLQFLLEVVPGASRVAYLSPRAVWDLPAGLAIREAARRYHVELVGALLAGDIVEAAYRRVFAEMARQRVEAMIVADAAENYAYQRLIIELAEAARLPAIYSNRQFVELGGLMAYGPDVRDLFRRAADDIAQILGGANPGDIPFYEATKFELIINLKTATALGLEVPPMLRAYADEVIE